MSLEWLQATTFLFWRSAKVLCAAQPGKPLSALSSEKLCEAVCQYIQYLIEYLFTDSFIEGP